VSREGPPTRLARVAGNGPIPVGSIEWEEHLEAHASYIARNSHKEGYRLLGPERIAELGGFGYLALVSLLGHPPRTWRPGKPAP
jgi:hypothetical protein